MSSRPAGRRVGRKALRTASALTLAATTALTALVALPATAGAAESVATVTKAPDGRSLIYTAAPGQTNNVKVTASNDGGMSVVFFYYIDDVVPIESPGDFCRHLDPTDRTQISCELYLGDDIQEHVALNMKLGDGNDAVAYDDQTGLYRDPTVIDLGAGKDTSTHTGGLDYNLVYGGPGDDNIAVHGKGRVWGQDGNDTISADGEGSRVDGGAGNDLISGGAGRQTLTGGTGNDTVRGGTGNDLIYGSPGNDVLYGNSGNDTIQGNSGNDKLYGGPGKDVLSGGPGRNVVRQN
ncbi:calcium-binding protein [Streptomyces sp. NBC_01390]|uniref:calcium-binding protein n=1 Tax=Streptomyces sp. NBC_01390 TaxID=2903850 RepID=UPI0032505447